MIFHNPFPSFSVQRVAKMARKSLMKMEYESCLRGGTLPLEAAEGTLRKHAPSRVYVLSLSPAKHTHKRAGML